MIPDTTSSLTPSAPEVICRRDTDYTLLAVVFFSISVLLPLALCFTAARIRLADVVAMLAIGFPGTAIGLYFGLSAARNSIAADARGLRWRGLTRERSVRWDEVTDYYIRMAGKRETPCIETQRGTIRLVQWHNQDELKQVVQQRAKNARSSEWEIRGTRTEENWPQTFTYDTAENRWMPWIVAATFLLFPIQILVNNSPSQLWSGFASIWQANGTFVTIALVLMTIAMGSAIPIMVMAMSLPAWRIARARRDERFVATPQHLVWQKGACTRTVPWAEVTNYYLLSTGAVKTPTLYVIEANGERLEWARALGGSRQLADITARFATNAAAKGWEEPENLTAREQREKQYAQSGERTFTYRTNVNRAFLWLLTFICLLPALKYGLYLALAPASGGPANGSPLPLFLVPLVAVWAWWRYYDASITLNHEGITQKTPFGARFIPWSETGPGLVIDNPALPFYRIYGREITIRIYYGLDGIAELRELVNESLTENSHRAKDTPHAR